MKTTNTWCDVKSFTLNKISLLKIAGDNSANVASRTPYAIKQSSGIRISVSPWSISRVAKSPRPAPELAESVKRGTFDIPDHNAIDLGTGMFQP
jgi:hypothetical protein